jgi:hypothetical protein
MGNEELIILFSWLSQATELRRQKTARNQLIINEL